jgi:hypothetical protein
MAIVDELEAVVGNTNSFTLQASRQPPNTPFIKLNFDGTLSESFDVVGIIIRDSNNSILCALLAEYQDIRMLNLLRLMVF